jgi:hypothetical protein
MVSESHLLSFSKLCPCLCCTCVSSPLWYQVSDWWGKQALNLAHGSSTLVFELGVEEIAAADGGDVEACVLACC